MSDELEPLGSDLHEALSQLQPPPEAPGVREALLSKLHASAGAGVASTVGVAASGGLTVPWWVAGVALMVGLGGGVVIDRAVGAGPAVVAPTVVEAPVAVAPSPPPRVDPEPSRPPDPSAIVAPDERPSRPSGEAARLTPRPKPVALVEARDAGSEALVVAPTDESLRSERLLIDAARAALARTPQAAMAPLDEHATRFPRGQLAEEREALVIQVLVLTNDGAAARARLEAFVRAFPSSPLRRALKTAVEGLE